ncbi:MAG TPA: hypothetical protein VKQ29_13075 [Aliidongia sp.]|nr:hypothetical protein [Aliidongia sp.]
MMNHVMSAAAAPLPAFARAAAFAVLAIATVGAAQLWQHGSTADQATPAAVTVDRTQPLAAAPSAVDMWRL